MTKCQGSFIIFYDLINNLFLKILIITICLNIQSNTLRIQFIGSINILRMIITIILIIKRLYYFVGKSFFLKQCWFNKKN